MRRLLIILTVAISLIAITLATQLLRTVSRVSDLSAVTSGWQVFNASAAQPGISGIVNYGGVPTSTIPLKLLFVLDNFESISDTTNTQSDGSYLFTKVAALDPGAVYQVSYDNLGFDPKYVAFWYSPNIETYAPNEALELAPFDIQNVPQLSPPDDSTATLPVTFTWTARQDNTDTYQIHIYNYFGEDYYSPPIPYTDHFRLDELPIELSYNETYFWEIVIYSPNGGYGVNTDFFGIKFTPTYKIYLPLATR